MTSRRCARWRHTQQNSAGEAARELPFCCWFSPLLLVFGDPSPFVLSSLEIAGWLSPLLLKSPALSRFVDGSWLPHFDPGSTQAAFQPSTLEGTGAALPSGVAKPGRNSAGSGDKNPWRKKPVATRNSSHLRWEIRLQIESIISKATFAKCSTKHSGLLGPFAGPTLLFLPKKNVLDVNAGPKNSSNFQCEILCL